MTKHHTLSIETFVKSIDWELFNRYFKKLDSKSRPSAWSTLNSDSLLYFLDDPTNVESTGIINEDFQRINDIAKDATGTLVYACKKGGIAFTPNESPAQLSMRLFLDYPDIFDYAWSRYLLYDTSSRLSIYPLAGLNHVSIDEEKKEAFRESIQEWFADLAKGEQCIVNTHEDRGQLVILIRRGAYIKSVPFWNGSEISINSFRPAIEDVLVYDSERSELSIKASQRKEREEYLALFASKIAGDVSLAERAINDEVFSLAPLQDGTFNLNGSGQIIKVELTRVRMKLEGMSEADVDIKALDINNAFKYDMGAITLNSGKLLMARFCFHILIPPKKTKRISFFIEPPSRTDLAQNQYTEIIEQYLIEQGVKLH